MFTNRKYTVMALLAIVYILIAMFVAVDLASAAPLQEQMPPVCTMTSTWMDKLFGKCLDIPVGTVIPANVDWRKFVSLINQATREWVDAHKGNPNQLIDGNWINDRAGDLYCGNGGNGSVDVTGRLVCQ